MRRITERDQDGKAYIKPCDIREIDFTAPEGLALLDDIAERLAQYEETGKEPWEVIETAETLTTLFVAAVIKGLQVTIREHMPGHMEIRAYNEAINFNMTYVVAYDPDARLVRIDRDPILHYLEHAIKVASSGHISK